MAKKRGRGRKPEEPYKVIRTPRVARPDEELYGGGNVSGGGGLGGGGGGGQYPGRGRGLRAGVNTPTGRASVRASASGTRTSASGTRTSASGTRTSASGPLSTGGYVGSAKTGGAIPRPTGRGYSGSGKTGGR